MHSNDKRDNAVSVPAALLDQLHNLATKSGDGMPFSPEAMPPGPTPRPQTEDQRRRADD